MPRLILDCWAVTTIISSTKSAENAADSNHSVVWICCTCLGWSWTAELLLPSFHLPKAQKMQQIQTTAWSESAVHAFADLGLLSCQTVNYFICQKRSKCLWFESAVHAFADLELLSCHYHHFICQNRSKCSRFKPQRGLNLLYMLSLILDCGAVTTIISSTKSAANACGLNLLHMLSLILDCWAVTTIISPTKSAANAADSNHSVVWICCTCLGWSWTAELLLPSFHLPKLQQIQQIQTTAWSESAVHAFADLGLRSCHYHHFI